MGKSSTETAKKAYVFATTALYFTLIFGSFLTGPSYAATAKDPAAWAEFLEAFTGQGGARD